jgi:hypothetical protein
VRREKAAQRDERQRAAVANDPYANAVIDALSGDFPDLRDPVVADLVRKYIYAYARTGHPLEIIVDNPISARWRLVGDGNHSGRVRLACWRTNLGEDDIEQEQRLNEALRAIGTETQR